MSAIGAAVDCEAIGVGLFRQPVNSATTLAFVVAGLWIASTRPDRRWVGLALSATGFGSFLFHGPMPAGAEWVHDVTLAWLLVVVAGTDTRWERTTRLPSLVALGVLFALFPAVADPAAAAIVVAAVVIRIRVDRTPHTWGALSLLAITAIIGRLGTAGGPLCDPESLIQPHGLWHLGAAASVVWWALATGPKEASKSPIDCTGD